MILRTQIRCPGCNGGILVRMGVAPTRGTRFYVPCPHCQLPILGNSQGEELESHRITFEGSERIDPFGDDEAFTTVTIDPNVPLRYSAQAMPEWGSSPNITFGRLVHGNTEVAMRALGALRSLGETEWSKVFRLYEYYLNEQWDHLQRQGIELVGEHWPRGAARLPVHSMVHHILLIAVGPTQVESFPGELFGEFAESHVRALRLHSNYSDFARSEVASGSIQRELRRTFDVLDAFMRSYESWLPGLTRWVLSPDATSTVDELRLCRDDFPLLRDLYQQAFETCCKSLRYVVGAINADKRGSPTAFPLIAPPGVTSPARHPVRTFAQFDRLTNADKMAYVFELPKWNSNLGEILDRRTRNAIGHSSVRHDLRTGEVVNDHGEHMSYFEFTGRVYRISYMLSLTLQILRSQRILGAQPSDLGASPSDP